MSMRSKIVRALLCLLVATVVLASCSPAPAAETPAATEVPLPTEEPPTAPAATAWAGPTAEEYAAEADAYVNGLAEMGLFSGAVLIAHDGEVLFSKGYGLADREQETANTPQTQFRLAGIGGQCTAMAILMLQDEGKLQVEDSICTHLPDCPVAWEPITVQHLLYGASGLSSYLDTLYEERLLATPIPPEDVVSLISGSPLRYQPGEKIDFLTGGSEEFLLAQIVEQASGTTYDDFLQQRIFAPLGMQDTGPVEAQADVATGYENDSSRPAPAVDESVVYGDKSHCSTVEDLLRWDQALYSEQLVPQALLDEMFADRGAFTGNGADVADQSGRSGAAYAWDIGEQFGHRDLQAGGLWVWGTTDFIDRYPDERVVIIVLSNQSNVSAPTVATALAKKLFSPE